MVGWIKRHSTKITIIGCVIFATIGLLAVLVGQQITGWVLVFFSVVMIVRTVFIRSRKEVK
jgi:uncharacterized membrane protein